LVGAQEEAAGLLDLTQRKTGVRMFRVKISIPDDRHALSDRMVAIRIWLDARQCEHASFRYAFKNDVIVCQVDFPAEAEAVEFANAFEGELIGNSPVFSAIRRRGGSVPTTAKGKAAPRGGQSALNTNNVRPAARYIIPCAHND
jgi:hypothetical protein